jgi:HAMP domain-containing protein
MKLNQFKIGARLGMAFGALLLLLLVAVGVGVQQASSLHARINHFAVVVDREAQLVGRLRSAVYQRAVAARNVTLKTDPQTQAAELDRIKKAKDTIDQTLAEAAQLIGESGSAKGAAAIAKAAQFEKSYEPIAAAVVAAATSGRQPEAIKKLTEECMPLLDEFTAHLGKLRDDLAAETAVAFEEATAAYNRALAELLILGAVALALGAALAWAVARSITRPLGEAVHLADAIAAGDLTRQPTSQGQTPGKDETSALLASMEQMRNRLASMVAEVRLASGSIATASQEVASGNEDLSKRTEQAAGNLQQTASSLEQLTGTVGQTADSARTANQLAVSASTAA